MIFDKNRKAMQRLAKEYGLPVSDVRQMLAIESGTITGDVREVENGRRMIACPWVLALVMQHLLFPFHRP